MTFCAGLLRGRGQAQKVTFFEVLGVPKGPKKVTFCAGMPGSCGEAFKGSGLRATFFEVFQAGKAQKR